MSCRTPCSGLFVSQPRWWSSNRVRLLVFEHVPENSRNSSHDGDTRDLRTPAPFDSAIPFLQLRITLQKVQDQLPQDEPCDLAAFFGDRTQPILHVARVTATGRYPKVVRQTARPRETFDGTDPARQRQSAVVAHTGSGHQDLCWAKDLTWFDLTCSLGNLFVNLGDLFIPSLPFLPAACPSRADRSPAARVPQASDGQPEFERTSWDSPR